VHEKDVAHVESLCVNQPTKMAMLSHNHITIAASVMVMGGQFATTTVVVAVVLLVVLLAGHVVVAITQ